VLGADQIKGTAARRKVDMIKVRRTGEGDPLEFEVVVREGQGEILTTSRWAETPVTA
jgi:hypothetical protein